MYVYNTEQHYDVLSTYLVLFTYLLVVYFSNHKILWNELKTLYITVWILFMCFVAFCCANMIYFPFCIKFEIERSVNKSKTSKWKRFSFYKHLYIIFFFFFGCPSNVFHIYFPGYKTYWQFFCFFFNRLIYLICSINFTLFLSSNNTR